MTTKPVFYSPLVEGAPALAAFLAAYDVAVLTTLRNSAAVAADPEAAPTKTFKTAKAAANAIAVITERQEKAGLVYGITVPEGGEGAWIAFSRNKDVAPELNVELTRSPAKLAAQAASARATVVKDKERVPSNPPSTPKSADAPASRERTDGGLVVRVKFDKNPRREGSKAAGRLALLTDGMTVDAFVAAVATVGNRLDKKLARRARRLLKKSAAAGHVELVDASKARIEADQKTK